MGKSPYEILRTKEIYAILDGDNQFGEYELTSGATIPVSMPYLSGSDLCSISTFFGLPVEYTWGGVNLSRWQYLDNLFEYCIENNRCSDLLSYLFQKEQFAKRLTECGANEIDEVYKYIVTTVLEKINGKLYFGGNELISAEQQFIIRKKGQAIEVEAPSIKMIDREYIKSITARAMSDVASGNYDSALTKSRTLLEEVFCHAIENKNEKPSTSGDISKLYNHVKNLYNMHAEKNVDRRINTLISGLNKIVDAIAEMRNKDSDSHGVGRTRISIDEHHARLFVNAATTVAEFVLSVENKANG